MAHSDQLLLREQVISMGEFVEDQTILWFDLKQIKIPAPVKMNMNIPDKPNSAD